MKKIGLVFDELCLKHSNGPGHPECPERLENIKKMLDDTGIINDLELLPPRDACEEDITSVHTKEHYNFIKSTKSAEFTSIDTDTAANQYSFDAAIRASGGLLSSLDNLIRGDMITSYTLPRPPGHHAEKDRAMGFCLFNHVAIGADYLIRNGFERVLIVDWDVHHGNGTQNIFYDRKNVLYFSTHQFPFYPGTGSLNEIGDKEGKGYTINVPMAARMNDDDHMVVFEKILRPVIEQYKPQFILVSAGFDSYFLDPLGGMQVTENGFSAMTRFVMEHSNKNCEGKLAFILEGGYNIQGLYTIMQSVFEELFERKNTFIEKPQPTPGCEITIESVIETYSGYWDF